MIVLDASATTDLLLRRGAHEDIFTLLTDHEAISSELLVPEVLSALRRFEHRSELTPSRASEAVEDLIGLPVELYATGPMAGELWGLRAAITPYDACYVTLATHLDAVLVTTDQRLGRTARLHCAVADL